MMNKLKVLIIILLFTNPQLLSSQSIARFGGIHYNKNYIYGDFSLGIMNLAGNIRINYERNITKIKIVDLNARVGIGTWFDYSSSGIELPISFQAILFDSPSHIELGIGSKWNRESNKSEILPIINLGYRYERYSKKTIFRFNLEYDTNYLIPFISYGVRF